jgi:hypothetical protein
MKPADWGRIGAVALLGIGLMALLWFVFLRPAQLKQQAAGATATAAQAGAQVKAAGDAAVITHRYTETIREVERVRDKGNAAIAAAEGADQPLAPDVYSAFVGALCLRESRAGDPACQRVQPAGGADAAPAEPEARHPAE